MHMYLNVINNVIIIIIIMVYSQVSTRDLIDYGVITDCNELAGSEHDMKESALFPLCSATDNSFMSHELLLACINSVAW